MTDAVFTATATAETVNPLETAEFFVRQQYLDFLSREPDADGLGYWTNEITRCGADLSCSNGRRRDVAAAFFIEGEFQQTGSFVYGLYKAGLGERPSFAAYSTDRNRIIAGANQDESKKALATDFVNRAEFLQKYPQGMNGASFIDALINNIRINSGADLSAMRDDLVSDYNQNQSRARILNQVVESKAFTEAEYNRAFVLAEYFGYLRRDPDEAGYQFWVNVLNNQDRNNYRGMVCAFVTSSEYQKRFGSLVMHSDKECGP